MMRKLIFMLVGVFAWMLRSMTTQFWGLWNGRIFRSKTTQSGDFTTKRPSGAARFRSIATHSGA